MRTKSLVTNARSGNFRNPKVYDPIKKKFTMKDRTGIKESMKDDRSTIEAQLFNELDACFRKKVHVLKKIHQYINTLDKIDANVSMNELLSIAISVLFRYLDSKNVKLTIDIKNKIRNYMIKYFKEKHKAVSQPVTESALEFIDNADLDSIPTADEVNDLDNDIQNYSVRFKRISTENWTTESKELVSSLLKIQEQLIQVIKKFVSNAAQALTEDTQLKPERTKERKEKIKITKVDIDLFKNIVRDTKEIYRKTDELVDDLVHNKGKNYDELTLELKRTFEPLIVTIQRLPDTIEQLGQSSAPQQARSSPLPPAVPTTPSFTVPGTTPGGFEQPIQEKRLYKRHHYSEKVPMKTRSGRIVWVLRSKIDQYQRKGYKIVAGMIPRALRRKAAKKRQKKMRTLAELYTGTGSHINMNRDQLEFFEDQVGDKSTPIERYILIGPSGRQCAVKKSAVKKYLNQGYKLKKDPQTQMPIVKKFDECKVRKELKKTLEEVLDSLIEIELKEGKKYVR
jgi:hypothetical protein